MSPRVPNEDGLRALPGEPEGTGSTLVPANEEGLLALGRTIDSSHGTPEKSRHGKRRRFRKTKWTVAIFASLAVLIAARGPATPGTSTARSPGSP